MSKTLIRLCLFLALGLASNSFADAIIGDWEGVSDGWTDWNGGSDVALSTLPSKYGYSTIWSSLNATSLKVTQAGWNQNLTIRSYQSTNPNFVSEFLSHSRFSIDMHFEGSEWANGSYAQIFELAMQGTGVDWKSYAMGDANETDTQNPTAPGQWGAPSSGTVSNYTTTVSWDYNAVKTTMVTAGLTSSSGYVNFIFTTNSGGSSTLGSFYFDNARLENPIALDPSPADGAIGVNLTSTLSWTASSGATSHDVYFGTASTPPSVSSGQAGTTYDPTLESSTTYYWRIDEHNAGGTVTGTVWSFTTAGLPSKASDPSPDDAATDVNLTPILSWTAGSGAASHHVYFGTTSPGTLQGNQDETTFNPPALDGNTTYYWRIDENNVNGTTTGDVWSFTTGNIYPLTITKCKVNAGKTQGADSDDITNVKDSIQLAGTAYFPTDANQITQLDINIISVTDDEIIYNQPDIDVSVVKNKVNYSYKIPKYHLGAITSLKMDFVKGTFSLTAKNVDLTGLGSPVKLEFVMGDATVSGEANEVIINGKKGRIPTRLMRMYDDKIVVTKATAKHKSTKALSDSLTVTGEIAVEDINNTDMNEPNLAARDVNFIWGDQTFTVRDGNFVAAKKGHSYKCSKIVSPDDANEGLISAKIDLDKCTFTISVKDVNMLNALPGYPDVNFGINYGIGDSNDFNEVVEVNLVTHRSY